MVSPPHLQQKVDTVLTTLACIYSSSYVYVEDVILMLIEGSHNDCVDNNDLTMFESTVWVYQKANYLQVVDTWQLARKVAPFDVYYRYLTQLPTLSK